MPPLLSINPSTTPFLYAGWDISLETGLANNDPIPTLTDRSIHGLTVSAPSTKRPLYITNELNGYPIARFDGIDDYFQAATAADWTFLHTGHPYTIMMLWKQRDANGAHYDTLFDTSAISTANAGMTAYYDNTGGGNNVHGLSAGVFRGVGGTSTATIATCKYAVQPRMWQLTTLRYKSRAKGQFYQTLDDLLLLNDGFLVGSGPSLAAASQSVAAYPFTLGAQGDLLGAAKIDLAGLWIFRPALPDDLLYGVHRFLQDKYAISGIVPVDTTGNYDHVDYVIRLPDGTLMTAYVSQEAHGYTTGPVLIRQSGDNGRSWSAPRLLGQFPGSTIYDTSGCITLLSNGVMLQSSFKGQIPPADALNTASIRRSLDGGYTWGAAITVANLATQWDACEAAPLEKLGSPGTVYLPIYISNLTNQYAVHVRKSTDYGATWGSPVLNTNEFIVAGPSATIQYSEACLIALDSTHYLIFMGDPLNRDIILATSPNCETWTLVGTVLDGWGRPDVVVLASGRLVIRYRESGGNFRGVIRWSADNGVTWSSTPYYPDPLNGLTMYGSIVETSPGVLTLTNSGELAFQNGPPFDITNPTQSIVRCRYMLKESDLVTYFP